LREDLSRQKRSGKNEIKGLLWNHVKMGRARACRKKRDALANVEVKSGSGTRLCLWREKNVGDRSEKSPFALREKSKVLGLLLEGRYSNSHRIKG